MAIFREFKHKLIIYSFLGSDIKRAEYSKTETQSSIDPVEKCLQVIWNIDVLENILKINAISVVILEWFIIKIEIHNHKKVHMEMYFSKS